MKYSEDQKHEAFLQYLCGHTPKEIADEAGVHFATVYRWINGWKKSLEGLPHGKQWLDAWPNHDRIESAGC